MTALSVWLFLFGVWPFADPGHDDLTAPMVLLDLALHVVGLVGCWPWLRARAADRRAEAHAAPVHDRRPLPRLAPGRALLLVADPVTHQSPPGDSGLMPCCQRSPLDVPAMDRLTNDPERVTCGR
jgi:hypothetical protein